VYIAMNIVAVNSQMAGHFEEAFRKRAGQVENAPGFVSFEVLRSTAESEYVVLTRWQTESDFQTWLKSDSFSQAHSGGSGAGMSASLKTYEVIQEVKGASA
jgi:heme oxygenase (mycobilin-producing)